MNEVERFDPAIMCGAGVGACGEYMEPSKNGDYVSYTDYAELQQQLAAAREEVKAARDVAEAWNADARADGYGGGSAKGREILDAMNATLQRDR